jgi:hypothetical protein
VTAPAPPSSNTERTYDELFDDPIETLCFVRNEPPMNKPSSPPSDIDAPQPSLPFPSGAGETTLSMSPGDNISSGSPPSFPLTQQLAPVSDSPADKALAPAAGIPEPLSREAALDKAQANYAVLEPTLLPHPFKNPAYDPMFFTDAVMKADVNALWNTPKGSNTVLDFAGGAQDIANVNASYNYPAGKGFVPRYDPIADDLQVFGEAELRAAIEKEMLELRMRQQGHRAAIGTATLTPGFMRQLP